MEEYRYVYSFFSNSNFFFQILPSNDDDDDGQERFLNEGGRKVKEVSVWNLHT